MRVGIVGGGIRGQLYAQALAGVEAVEVAGLCDPSPRARESAKRVFHGPVVENHRDLYELGLDAAIIATPDFAHVAAAVDAAEAGLALMIEKPLAMSSADAEVIAAAVAKADVSCLVAFENRWNPHFLKVRSLIESGALGRIVHVSGVLSNSYYVPQTMLSWSAKSSPGWFLMPHLLDLAMWLTGGEPEQVRASGTRGILAQRGIDTWDTIDALVNLSSGAVANLRTAWVLPEGSRSIVDFRVEIIGTEGSAQVNMTEQGLYTATDRAATHWALPSQIDGTDHGMAQWMARSWAEHLVAGDPIGPDAHHGVVVSRTIEQVHAALLSR